MYTYIAIRNEEEISEFGEIGHASLWHALLYKALKNIVYHFTFIKIIVFFFPVGAQRPDIVDEILPEVKQKTQTGYLNCTVVNKGSESVVGLSSLYLSDLAT